MHGLFSYSAAEFKASVHLAALPTEFAFTKITEVMFSTRKFNILLLLCYENSSSKQDVFQFFLFSLVCFDRNTIASWDAWKTVRKGVMIYVLEVKILEVFSSLQHSHYYLYFILLLSKWSCWYFYSPFNTESAFTLSISLFEDKNQ